MMLDRWARATEAIPNISTADATVTSPPRGPLDAVSMATTLINEDVCRQPYVAFIRGLHGPRMLNVLHVKLNRLTF